MLATASLYLPEVSPMLAGHEEPQLQEAFPTEAGEIDNLRAQLQTPQRSYIVDFGPFSTAYIPWSLQRYLTRAGILVPDSNTLATLLNCC